MIRNCGSCRWWNEIHQQTFDMGSCYQHAMKIITQPEQTCKKWEAKLKDD